MSPLHPIFFSLFSGAGGAESGSSQLTMLADLLLLLDADLPHGDPRSMHLFVTVYITHTRWRWPVGLGVQGGYSIVGSPRRGEVKLIFLE